jgi:hypothetical protein
MSSTDLLERRLTRLHDELEDAGVRIDGPRAMELLREVDRARSPRRHERRFPSYGAIVSGEAAATLSTLDKLGAVRLKPLPGTDPGVRAMADGVQAFAFVRPDAAELVLLASPVGREIELVRLRRSLGPATTLVCRTDDAVVRVYRPGEIVIFDGTRWWTKPDARNYGLSVRRALPAAPLDVTQHILDFCVHTAGPGAGGTMLVWCLDPDTLDQLRNLSAHTRLRAAAELPLTLPVAHSAIRQLLFQVDGAAAVDPEGTVVEIGLHLRPSTSAHRSIPLPAFGGTRHAAAQRSSKDFPNAIFFVVSDDGPVTVFNDGRTIASIVMDTDLGAVTEPQI